MEIYPVTKEAEQEMRKKDGYYRDPTPIKTKIIRVIIAVVFELMVLAVITFALIVLSILI